MAVKKEETTTQENKDAIIAELKRQIAMLSQELEQTKADKKAYEMFHEGVIVGQKIVLFDNLNKGK